MYVEGSVGINIQYTIFNAAKLMNVMRRHDRKTACPQCHRVFPFHLHTDNSTHNYQVFVRCMPMPGDYTSGFKFSDYDGRSCSGISALHKAWGTGRQPGN